MFVPSERSEARIGLWLSPGMPAIRARTVPQQHKSVCGPAAEPPLGLRRAGDEAQRRCGVGSSGEGRIVGR
jgi:hypothetical protein